jgi:hypothetical protein
MLGGVVLRVLAKNFVWKCLLVIWAQPAITLL